MPSGSTSAGVTVSGWSSTGFTLESVRVPEAGSVGAQRDDRPVGADDGVGERELLDVAERVDAVAHDDAATATAATATATTAAAARRRSDVVDREGAVRVLGDDVLGAEAGEHRGVDVVRLRAGRHDAADDARCRPG